MRIVNLTFPIPLAPGSKVVITGKLYIYIQLGPQRVATFFFALFLRLKMLQTNGFKMTTG